MLTTTVLTTRRLRLRTWRRTDLGKYNNYCNTDEVMEWLGGTLTQRELRQEYAYFARQLHDNGFTFWVMERKHDKSFLGFCGIVRVDERSSTVLGEVEIGWRVRSDMWRRGYAYEAAQSVLSHAFSGLGITRIVARVAPGNAPSRSLMRKLGMTRVKHLDYIHPADGMRLLVYAITNQGPANGC